MFTKLLETLQNHNQQSENSFSVFDLEAFRKKAAQTLRIAFRSMDEKSKLEFLAWISAVREIRNLDLSYREKEVRISQLPNTETALQTLKAVLDAAIQSAPEPEQKGIRTSLAGIGTATSLLGWKVPSGALMLVGQALPKFLLTPQFEVVAAFLEKELERLMKELNSPAIEK